MYAQGNPVALSDPSGLEPHPNSDGSWSGFGCEAGQCSASGDEAEMARDRRLAHDADQQAATRRVIHKIRGRVEHLDLLKKKSPDLYSQQMTGFCLATGVTEDCERQFRLDFVSQAVSPKDFSHSVRTGVNLALLAAGIYLRGPGMKSIVGPTEAEGLDFVNLASLGRTIHILHGDATGGGHLWPGASGKTPFPQSWSGNKIMHVLSDIATDPAAWVNAVTRGGRAQLIGSYDGVDILVVVSDDDIITGYPLNLPRNP